MRDFQKTFVVPVCALVAGFVASGAWAQSLDISATDAGGRMTSVEGSMHYGAGPRVYKIAEFESCVDVATITDVEIADFNGDGRNDVAVAWYATDFDSGVHNQRKLMIFVNKGLKLSLRATIDLYIRDVEFEAMSVFRNGTSDIGVGDFDGDGDMDLAVTPFFGDELWFIENLGDATFEQHLRFPFGFNSTGNFMTPPEALAADFDGDGRDELVYIADPVLYWDGAVIHFWKTTGAIEDIFRIDWEGIEGGVFTQWTRGLAVGDFDGDGGPDLCYSGSINPPLEDDPILTFWYGLDVASRRFSVHSEFPSMLCSDVVDVPSYWGGPSGVILTDLDGFAMQYWAPFHGVQVDFELAARRRGYAALSPNRGMAAVVADMDGDGDWDLVTKQKLGTAGDSDQIEVTLCGGEGIVWKHADPIPFDTSGFMNHDFNGILRPRNLAVGDLYGNKRPEVVAGFAASSLQDDPGDFLSEGRARRALKLAFWQWGCIGDVNCDGRTNEQDSAAMSLSAGSCIGDEDYNRNADLDNDGCVTPYDLAILMRDMDCGCQDGPPS